MPSLILVIDTEPLKASSLRRDSQLDSHSISSDCYCCDFLAFLAFSVVLGGCFSRLDLEVRYLGVYDKEEWAIKAVDFTFVKSAATFQDRTRSRSWNTIAY